MAFVSTSAYPTSTAVGNIFLSCNLFLSGHRSQTNLLMHPFITGAGIRPRQTPGERRGGGLGEKCSVTTGSRGALLHRVTVFELIQPQETDVPVCGVVINDGWDFLFSSKPELRGAMCRLDLSVTDRRQTTATHFRINQHIRRGGPWRESFERRGHDKEFIFKPNMSLSALRPAPNTFLSLLSKKKFAVTVSHQTFQEFRQTPALRC